MKSTELLSFSLALVLSLSSVEGRALFSWLHGNGADAENLGGDDSAGSALLLTEEDFTIGRRGLACLQYAAGVENDPFGDLGIMIGPVTRVLKEYFGESGLNMVCASTRQGRQLLEEASEEPIEESMANTFTETTILIEEDTQTCAAQASAVYPTDETVDPQKVYTEYATAKYQGFVNNGDLRQRSSTPIVIEKLQNEIAVLRDVQTGLETCSSIWGTLNGLVSIADVPFVDLVELSEAVQGFSCDLVADYNDIVISRRSRDIERLIYHDQLIDSAEVQAAFVNTQNMLSEVCSVTKSIESMRLEMEVLSVSVQP